MTGYLRVRGPGLGDALLWTAAWGLIMAVALWSRPHLPVDETRYLAVAWEMWLRQDWLVPHLNGEPYSHKPPLLFWLMNLGWALFGVNDWWPRLVAPAFGLGSLFLTARLARALWPAAPGAARLAPVVLVGALFWTLYTSLTMFDMLLAFFTLVGLLGLVRAGRAYGSGAAAWGGFALFGLGIGLGVLAKGPAILLHVLPAALAAPWWLPAVGAGAVPVPWRRWYGGVLGGVLLGAALSLVWAVSAGIAGGAEYREAIFWGQSAGRMVESFAHGRPWWWYLAVLPPLVLPWLIWPGLWRAAARYDGDGGGDGGLRLIAVWFGVSFVAFSLISGKQLHYLLPEFPALALVAARVLDRGVPTRRWDMAPAVVLFGLFGLVLVAAPLFADRLRLPHGIAPQGWWGLLVLAAAAAAWVARPVPVALRLAGLSVAAVVALHLALAPILWGVFDMGPAARQLARWEAQGYDLAHAAKYHGQFNFAGRLRRPIATIGLDRAETRAWLDTHPRAKVISYRAHRPTDAVPDLILPFRGRFLVVWDAALVRADPAIAARGT
ncbi:MAG: glycosyltransferase family 39 protein [Hyphomicrobiales bacterium]|nr:glycosyltransferase family 39 protein [Hyphomicrobiales bacterium]MCP5373370.1 glycosyltransferase family 39 protein [Hyphomicrobiales bacterium]